MRFPIIIKALMATFILAILGSQQTARAEGAYPSGPIRMIVGFAPGGVVDLMARYLAKNISDDLGQTIIVENRPGASGNIGAQFVSLAKPDGYTLLVTTVVHSINASLYSSLPFDPSLSFTAISPIAVAPNSIAVSSSSPFRTLADLVAFAKSHPGEVTYGSPGVGTLTHIGMEQFAESAGIKLQHISYNGTGPAMNATLSSEVSMLSTAYGSAAAFVKGGTLRMLGIATAQPSPLAPEVPTIADAAAIPGYEAMGWVGLLGPANMPKDIAEKLNSQVRKMQDSKEAIEWLATQGAQTYILSPDRFAAVVKGDAEKWGKIVRSLGIKAE
jgi:hypothetical protein